MSVQHHGGCRVRHTVCSGAGKDLVILLKWYVDMGSRVSVPLGKAKIDNVDIIATMIGTDQKIGGFNVTVNEVQGVDALNT